MMIRKGLYQGQKQTRKAMSTASGIVILMGLIGLILFGYFSYQATLQGGYNSLQTITDGVGLVLSGILML